MTSALSFLYGSSLPFQVLKASPKVQRKLHFIFQHFEVCGPSPPHNSQLLSGIYLVSRCTREEERGCWHLEICFKLTHCNEFIPYSDLQQQAKVIPTKFKLEFQSSIHQRNENRAHSRKRGLKLHRVIMWLTVKSQCQLRGVLSILHTHHVCAVFFGKASLECALDIAQVTKRLYLVPLTRSALFYCTIKVLHIKRWKNNTHSIKVKLFRIPLSSLHKGNSKYVKC